MTTLLVMAGGTGGHVFPALAVANDLRSRGIDVVWLGTASGVEARAVPAAGFDVEWINIKGVRGSGILGWIGMPFRLLRAMLQTGSVILRRKPSAVLGMGGFVAGPGGLTGWLMRRPLLIHEANARAGMTNRLLAHFACRIMTGFPGVFAGRAGCAHVGNPVAAGIRDVEPPETRLRGRGGRLRLLVVGGSQGALALNRFVPAALGAGEVAESLEIWHQSGRGRGADLRDLYHRHQVQARVDEFIDDMAAAYAWADLVVCRAGAMTVAEVCAAGVVAIFVPFPFAAGDHQTANADFLASRDAALLIPQDQLDPTRFVESIRRFMSDRDLIVETARRARSFAKPNATRAVADLCVEKLRA